MEMARTTRPNQFNAEDEADDGSTIRAINNIAYSRKSQGSCAALDQPEQYQNEFNAKIY
jgi:hypothetical protein